MFLVHLWGKKNNKKVQKFLRCFYYIYGGKRTTKNSKEIPEMFLLNERVKKYQSLLYATRKNDLLNIFYNTIYIFHTPCEKSLGESRGKSAIARNFPYYSWFFNWTFNYFQQKLVIVRGSNEKPAISRKIPCYSTCSPRHSETFFTVTVWNQLQNFQTLASIYCTATATLTKNIAQVNSHCKLR